jgi:hypothetical protein
MNFSSKAEEAEKTLKKPDLDNGGQSVHSKTKISVIAVSDQDSDATSSKSAKPVEEEREPVILDQEAIK